MTERTQANVIRPSSARPTQYMHHDVSPDGQRLVDYGERMAKASELQVLKMMEKASASETLDKWDLIADVGRFQNGLEAIRTV